MHAPGALGRAFRHLVQKYHSALPFLHPHGMRRQPRQPIRQFRKLMEMCGENRAAADRRVQRFQHRPRDGEPVQGGGATADLVHHHQGARPGLVQDRRGLGHLDHEGGAPARQVVRSADAAEQPVHHADPRAIQPAPAGKPAPARRSVRSAGGRWTCRPCSVRSAAERGVRVRGHSDWGRRQPDRQLPLPRPDDGRRGSGTPRHR